VACITKNFPKKKIWLTLGLFFFAKVVWKSAASIELGVAKSKKSQCRPEDLHYKQLN
jgi:hypothetical protein